VENGLAPNVPDPVAADSQQDSTTVHRQRLLIHSGIQQRKYLHSDVQLVKLNHHLVMVGKQ
jgi:hypothetical protein